MKKRAKEGPFFVMHDSKMAIFGEPKKTESKTLPAFSGAPIEAKYPVLPQYFQVMVQPLVQVGGKEHCHCISFLS